jgi:hypothetical protein
MISSQERTERLRDGEDALPDGERRFFEVVVQPFHERGRVKGGRLLARLPCGDGDGVVEDGDTKRQAHGLAVALHAQLAQRHQRLALPAPVHRRRVLPNAVLCECWCRR